jgi:hypothetical protein
MTFIPNASLSMIEATLVLWRTDNEGAVAISYGLFHELGTVCSKVQVEFVYYGFDSIAS